MYLKQKWYTITILQKFANESNTRRCGYFLEMFTVNSFEVHTSTQKIVEKIVSVVWWQFFIGLDKKSCVNWVCKLKIETQLSKWKMHFLYKVENALSANGKCKVVSAFCVNSKWNWELSCIFKSFFIPHLSFERINFDTKYYIKRDLTLPFFPVHYLYRKKL